MVLEEEPIQIVDCYIIPFYYGDLLIHINSQNNPIKIEYYERSTNELRLSQDYENFSTMNIDDVINDFIEPLPIDIINPLQARSLRTLPNYDADIENSQ